MELLLPKFWNHIRNSNSKIQFIKTPLWTKNCFKIEMIRIPATEILASTLPATLPTSLWRAGRRSRVTQLRRAAEEETGARQTPFSRRCHFCPDPPLSRNSSCFSVLSSAAKSKASQKFLRNSIQKKSELLRFSIIARICVCCLAIKNVNLWFVLCFFKRLKTKKKPLKSKFF